MDNDDNNDSGMSDISAISKTIYNILINTLNFNFKLQFH